MYVKFFPNHIKELKKAVGNLGSLLDVGCGENSPIKYLDYSFYSVGIDLFEPSIRKSRGDGIHDKYLLMDALDLKDRFGSNSFDGVLALDLIEHLEKDRGRQLIGQMEDIARKRVILITPNGFLPQESYGENPHQTHKSGWKVGELKDLGYSVMGISGWKFLKGEKASIRFKPTLFWRVVSILSQPLVKHHPEKAFELLCVKDL